MVSIHVDLDELEWMPGSAKYGAVAIHNGKEIIQSKILSDRRAEGGGLALLSRVSPPPGKLVKIVAVARSDEHVFNPRGRPRHKIRPACTRRWRLHAQLGRTDA
jgi:hypothetical protein